MCRDAVSASGFTDEGGFRGTRFAAVASAVTGFTQRGDVINVYTEF
jgi:hypothetical protein